MTLATIRAAGFFRFPGRTTTRIAHGKPLVREVARPGHPSAKASFRLRHVEIEAKPIPASPHAVPARITVRV